VVWRQVLPLIAALLFSVEYNYRHSVGGTVFL
jgi:hypothetical protein